VRRATVLARFRKALRELRTERGLSQDELAARAGLDRNYIGMIERGARNPAIVNVVKIAEALDVTPSELFRDFK